MRADTAAVATLTLVQASLGDMRERSPWWFYLTCRCHPDLFPLPQGETTLERTYPRD